MRNKEPFMPGFWEDYQNMMHNTFSQVQSLLNGMGSYMGTAESGNVSINGNKVWNPRQNPDIRVDEKYVTVSLMINTSVNKSNTQIYLEGAYLIIDGLIQAKVPLPVAVQKYGGRAVFKEGTLEVTLLRDKYTSKQLISLETDKD